MFSGKVMAHEEDVVITEEAAKVLSMRASPDILVIEH